MCRFRPSQLSLQLSLIAPAPAFDTIRFIVIVESTQVAILAALSKDARTKQQICHRTANTPRTKIKLMHAQPINSCPLPATCAADGCTQVATSADARATTRSARYFHGHRATPHTAVFYLSDVSPCSLPIMIPHTSTTNHTQLSNSFMEVATPTFRPLQPDNKLDDYHYQYGRHLNR